MNKVTKNLFAAFGIFLMSPAFASAATMGVAARERSATVGAPFEADVTLDTKGETMNAVTGEFTFPPALFALTAINDGDSPVGLWIDAPHEVASGVIAFAGIVPGGFNGATQSLFEVVLTPRASGSGNLAIGDVELLRNDGQGSAMPLAASNATVTVAGPLSGASSGSSLPPTRFTVPERFMPVVSRDPGIFDGQYFLAFATTDKGSGLDHYDVLEVPAGTAIGQDVPWQTVASPYLLKDQTLGSDIYVRAVSRAGTVLVAKVPAEFPGARQTRAYAIAAIMLSCLLAVGAAMMFAMRRRSRRAGV